MSGSGPLRGATGSRSNPPDKDRLRDLIMHLVAVAQCYEWSDSPSEDPASLAMLRDVAARIGRHKAAYDSERAKGSAMFELEELTLRYRDYLADQRTTRDQLRADIADFYACGGTRLTPDELDILAPPRERIIAYGRQAQYAKYALGKVRFDGAHWKTIHNWKMAVHDFDPPKAFGFGVDGPAVLRYVLEALQPFSDDPRRRDEEAVLRRAWDAMEAAITELEARHAALLARHTRDSAGPEQGPTVAPKSSPPDSVAAPRRSRKHQ